MPGIKCLNTHSYTPGLDLVIVVMVMKLDSIQAKRCLRLVSNIFHLLHTKYGMQVAFLLQYWSHTDMDSLTWLQHRIIAKVHAVVAATQLSALCRSISGFRAHIFSFILL